MMYDELVKRLRIGTKYFPGYILYPDGGVQPFYLTPKDIEQAADAIEGLELRCKNFEEALKELDEKLDEVEQKTAENAQTNADKIRAMGRDEGIRMGVELAAMHGADATSKQLEDAFWCGFEEAMKKRDVVVQKHGKWILKQEYDICEEDGEKYWECSLCRCRSDSYDTTFHTKFCPNCGAKMEAEVEE